MTIKNTAAKSGVGKRIAAFIIAAAAAVSLSSVTAVAAETADSLGISYSDALIDGYEDYAGYDGYVSGSDVSATDHIAEYPLEEIDVGYFRLKMLVPRFEMSFSAADTNKEIHDKLYDNYGIGSLQDVLNYSDYYGGSNTCYLYNGSSKGGGVTMMVMYDENQYTRFIGDYTRLSEDEINDICENSDFLSSTDPVYPRSIGGRTFLCQVDENSDAGSATYYAGTIVGGGLYTVYIDLSGADQMDDNTVDRILSSIRIKGAVKERYGAASRTWATILSVVCGLLALAVALLSFFLWRFNAFAKAAGSSFSVLGFNLPPKDVGAGGTQKRHSDKHR